MSDFEYKIPDTYEEAVKRKADVLQMINDYNVALLLGNDLPYTDEEIEQLQEEYQILNDHLALTEEERLAKLNEDDIIVNEDGTIEEKKSIFDKIHWSFYLVAVITLLVTCGIFTYSIGTACMEKIMSDYFEDLLWNKEVGGYELIKSEYMWSQIDYWLRVCFSYLWLPLAGILVSVAYHFVVRKRNDLTPKFSFWLVIINVALLVISVAIIFLPNDFQKINDLKNIYDALPTNYYLYVYSETGGSGY